MGTSSTTSTTTASAGISGIVSGVQWQDLVDQMAAADKARSVTPVQDRITAGEKRKTAWNDLKGLVTKLQDAANVLKLGTAFSDYAATVSASGQTGRTLLSTSATAAAKPGSYRVEVVNLARAEKLSGAVVSDSTAALGLAGSFSVAGQSVSVTATDSLEAVRDKINALNGGATPTKVSASVLSSASGQKRLVISADAAGSAGAGLTDGSEGVLRDLGFVDSRSRAVPSSGLAVAAALGVTSPPPSTIKVGSRTISVDLSVDSISTIVAKIRAAGGQAEVQTETVGGVPSYRMSVGGTVSATNDPNSAATITALGFAAGSQTTVQQVVASGLAFQDTDGSPATAATKLTDLKSNGQSLGLSVGDTLTFSGQRGDGSTVNVSFVVGGADTMATLLSKMNDAATGFGSGSRTATASIDPDGKLRLNDNTGGDSRLRLAMSVSPAAGGAAASLLGTFGTETIGRARTMTTGSDAQVRVDGVLITRGTNTISDALDGVTLNLLQAEPGSEVDLTVTRNLESSMTAIKGFAKAYNDIVSFEAGQQLDGQPLQYESTLRRVLGTFTQALRTTVADGGTYDRGTRAGFTLTRSGSIELDEAKLRGLLGTNLSNMQALFGSTGIAGAMVTAAQRASRLGDGTITNEIANITTANQRLSARLANLQDRVDARKQALILRFSNMEAAMSRLQQQTNSLTSLTGSR